jgi:hypothetical protein
MYLGETIVQEERRQMILSLHSMWYSSRSEKISSSVNEVTSRNLQGSWFYKSSTYPLLLPSVKANAILLAQRVGGHITDGASRRAL